MWQILFYRFDDMQNDLMVLKATLFVCVSFQAKKFCVMLMLLYMAADDVHGGF